MQADLKKQMGKTARKDFVLEGKTIVKKGEAIAPEAADKLGEPTEKALAAYEADRERARVHEGVADLLGGQGKHVPSG